jgi:hypothetical protein
MMENWANKEDSEIYKQVAKMLPKVKKAYENRDEADQNIAESWRIYNCEPDDNQVYQGNSQCYVPVVRDAINARTRRALKQNFPVKYKHVDAVGTDGEKPTPELSMLEHHIRCAKLKSTCRSMYVAGDITGQWCLYVDWMKNTRNVSDMIKRNPKINDELSDPTEEEESLEENTVVEQGIELIDFAVEDLAVIPPTVNEIEKADIVALKMRMSKNQVQYMIDKEIFVIDDDDIDEWIDTHTGKDKNDPPKDRSEEAGIDTKGITKQVLVYECTARVKYEDDKKYLTYFYFTGDSTLLGIIKAPQWSQKRPILSAPVDRVGGSFFGISKIESVKRMQWNLNDFWNMGQDSAMYSLLPIVMTDPEKNPNYAMMVFGLASVWPVDPNSTKFENFPQLYKESIQMCSSIAMQIRESLDVNEMHVGAGSKGGKKNAAASAGVQQEAAVAVIDHAERFEEEILTPLLQMMFELDTQFRDDELTTMSMGDIGVKAQMMKIPPIQWGNRYFFQWVGTEYVLNMQRMQQQIATMNVLRGMNPQQLNGRKIDIAPIIEILVDNVFGSELAGRILIDDRRKFTLDPQVESELMLNNVPIETHPADPDELHLQTHQLAARLTQDPTGLMKVHIQDHIKQLMTKRKEQIAGQAKPAGLPGVPGGAGPGVAGTPTMGAQPNGPRPMPQQPPGAIRPDQMPH